MSSSIRINEILKNGKPKFCIVDSDNNDLVHPKVNRVIERYKSYFSDVENYQFIDSINYVSLIELIDRLDKALVKIGSNKVELSTEVQNFIQLNKYAIREHQIAGKTIKGYDNRWDNEVEEFNKIISNEITRPLLEKQVQASFYLAKMKRAANFSVPGAGKTAMMYGAFAYLSSKIIDEVNKVMVVCPINAFEAWRSEFELVFGEKRRLMFMNLRDKRYSDFGNIRLDWGISNVIVVNYESLERYLKVLNELIDTETMIVFDEVHRVKGVNGRRAKAALRLGKKARYHYVLTGTPIPNTYKDIYNFLHLLYDNEYNNYFGWEVYDLEAPHPESVNNKVQPFFWRTNKNDLNIPKAEPDELIVVEPNANHLNLVKAIYDNEPSVLALYIRLLQASTNPSLILENINYSDLGFLDDEIDLTHFNALNDEEHEKVRIKTYLELDVNQIESEKFKKGIKLINELVNDGKKVIVWGIFVKTMFKIRNTLRKSGINTIVIYGGTPKEDRVNLINGFRDGEVQVLVSNPNTLGESISLHQTVHDAVYFEFNFNLTFMLQSRDRIHRLGLQDNQYTKYHYLMSEGDRAHESFIDKKVYTRLKEKEEVMLKAIDGELLLPEVSDDYLDDIKRIISTEINKKETDVSN